VGYAASTLTYPTKNDALHKSDHRATKPQVFEPGGALTRQIRKGSTTWGIVMRGLRRFLRQQPFLTLAGVTLLLAGSSAQAGFLDDNADFGTAIAALRTAIGDHPRVLKIEVDAAAVVIEAQDPRNRNHVDRWRYGTATYLGVFPIKRLSGPQPVTPQLINPDLEANLFDLDAVDFSAAPKPIRDAVARARLQDAAAVTRMTIERQTFILPAPSSGHVRWTVRVDSGREHAEVHADARGAIVGADLGATQRARTLNLLDEPALVADAATAFRASVGAGKVLTAVSIDAKTVGFSTNISDQSMARLAPGLPTTASFTWSLNGLQRRLGAIDVSAQMGRSGPAPFSVDDVDWTILAKLAQDALARAALPRARVTRLAIAMGAEQPGGPALAWRVELTEPSGEVTLVFADPKGAIQRVVLPASRRPKPKWLDAATIAEAIARIAPTFGGDVQVASIAFDDRGGRITLDDPSQGGRAATFDVAPDTFTRATISFSFDSMGPRFAVGDLASLDEPRIAAMQAGAMSRLGGQRTVWLESVRIGAHPFVGRAGAHAIEVRLRDRAEDSAQAHYAWIVFDFDGRVLDSSGF
jgi:hypothetical protein